MSYEADKVAMILAVLTVTEKAAADIDNLTGPYMQSLFGQVTPADMSAILASHTYLSVTLLKLLSDVMGRTPAEVAAIVRVALVASAAEGKGL